MSHLGRTVGRLRFDRLLGKGGMGEVYAGFDTELERKVALKVLPLEWAEDPDRLARFRREAKAIAALNHPNIVSIHSVEEVEGFRFIVMELVEGQTLGEVIARGGLGVSEFLDLAIPLAEALAAAHERGIVHRDLKPGNVMVTGEGRVKVLDFGLAKLHLDLGYDAETRTWIPGDEMTREGAVLGTLPYMSPEQVQGKPVDHRSDIFSLGIVLYEMATGERPFQGENAVELASSIMKDSPASVADKITSSPRALSRIIDHCLEKDPERRFQSAKDVRNELESLRKELESEVILASKAYVGSKPPAARRRWLIGALAVAVALVGLLVYWQLRPTEEPPAAVSEPATSAAPAPERPMIVVLPFENLGPPEDEYFAAGMTEEITSRLARG